MKATVHKTNLQRALGFVERVTSKNTALPILSNVLLKTEHERLIVAATNLEVGITSAIAGKMEQDGCIAVPGRILSDFVRGVPQDTVTLETKNTTLTVQAGSFKTTILGFDGSEYPIIPKLSASNTKVIPAATLRMMASTITDCIALSESRPELAGAYLDFQPSAAVMVATDSFRLAEHRIPLENTIPSSMIIPRNAILELTRALSDVDGDIQVITADNQVSFVHEDFEIISRLVDGKYPNYKPFIPETYITKALIRKTDLEDAVKVAALFASSISDIKIECGEQEVRITAKNSSKGEAQTAAEANIKGDPFDITLNYHYFLDGLKTILTDKVIMEFTGKGSPFILRPNTESKDSVYLIMPLKG